MPTGQLFHYSGEYSQRVLSVYAEVEFELVLKVTV
jgi:hypothetical protein